MITHISNYLFIISGAVLILALIVKGAFSVGASRNRVKPNLAELDHEMSKDHQEVIEEDQTILKSIFKSYLMWAGAIGMTISILLPKWFL
ncbi:hypothetical protein NV379_14110 [Paenibacillus sp. N1-5-1-14]|uniref:hypothetical protein n=1 Tax=Paenibacillus radicibacter TaxID=2972488 RepID=UPI002158F28C|nr:hypothetical protein [Paenibacillus radicibacter]MCR8643786.1 hypothetical protein [Paenibacillus radicibacter]